MDPRQLESAYHQMKERALRDAHEQHRRDREYAMKCEMMQPMMMDMAHAQRLGILGAAAGGSLAGSAKSEEKTKEPTQQAPDNKLLLLL